MAAMQPRSPDRVATGTPLLLVLRNNARADSMPCCCQQAVGIDRLAHQRAVIEEAGLLDDLGCIAAHDECRDVFVKELADSAHGLHPR